MEYEVILETTAVLDLYGILDYITKCVFFVYSTIVESGRTFYLINKACVHAAG